MSFPLEASPLVVTSYAELDALWGIVLSGYAIDLDRSVVGVGTTRLLVLPEARPGESVTHIPSLRLSIEHVVDVHVEDPNELAIYGIEDLEFWELLKTWLIVGSWDLRMRCRVSRMQATLAFADEEPTGHR